MSKESDQKAQEFLKIAGDYQLGVLPTEQRHPLTHDLARQSREDVSTAINILKGIDLGVLRHVRDKLPELSQMRNSIKDTLDAGHNVYFYGCGATGRLSLSIEYIWRYIFQDQPDMLDSVHGFMTGGDVALVYAMESFEDYPEIGARHLHDMGFTENDLLISCTEGGETPSVIGATEEAAKVSQRRPWYLYSNPDEVLKDNVERSRRVLENDNIRKICLFVGPMAISGSTRLQSTTALQMGSAWALLDAATDNPALKPQAFIDFVEKTDFSFLEKFAIEEADIYQRGEYLLYETDIYGITILTDTTERSPTFSLQVFENRLDETIKPSMAYIYIPFAKTPQDGWQSILLRQPYPINWPESKGMANETRLMGFDFSNNALGNRTNDIAPAKLHRFIITRQGNDMVFELNDHSHRIDVSGLHPLYEQMLLKLLLNIHSAIVMGRLHRIESNIMTWVKPSNNKLIDRAIRYVEGLLHHNEIFDFSYEDICHALYEEIETLTPDEAVVLKTLENVKAKHQALIDQKRSV